MFDAVAARYDLVNDVLSFGLHRRWRRQAAESLGLGPRDVALDIGCGTGALSRRMSERSRIVGVDVSAGMLGRARQRQPARSFVRGSAFRLPFRTGAFTAVASAFVLRNLQDLPAAFAEMARVLSKGGRVALVDITVPRRPAARRLFLVYFRHAAPFLGSLASNAEAYRYLVGSVSHLPPAESVLDLLREAGFEKETARELSGGMVTLFTAVRSEPPGSDGGECLRG